MELELEILRTEFDILPDWKHIMLVWTGETSLRNIIWLKIIIFNFFRKPHFFRFNGFVDKEWRLWHDLGTNGTERKEKIN